MGLNRQFFAALAFAFAFFVLGLSKYLSGKLIIDVKSGNRLLQDSFEDDNSTECKNRTIDEFPSDIFPTKDGGILIHVLITFYAFAALSVICDEFFVQSLTLISRDLKLKDDVAGATFMAAGSSSPELFTSLVGVIFAKSDVGIGTIVGSALFNVFFIIGMCGLAAKKVLNIDWYPMSRDCVFYILSVASLIIVLNDGRIHWYEATVLLVMYLFYIVVMYFNSNIESLVKDKDDEDEGTKGLLLASSMPRFDNVVEYDLDADDEDEPLNPFKIPDTTFKKVLWIVLFPVNLVFFLTVPDCRRKRFSRFPFYFITFLMSTLYLGTLTYVLVWMVVIIADVIGMPDTVAGLTVLAAGTSLPEVISGIIITRRGKGDMAISNSIGSNIFDILICLGLPWFLHTAILDPGSSIKIFSGGLIYSTTVLLSSVFLLAFVFVLNRWRLDKKLGVLMIIFWIIGATFMCLLELDVFGKFSLPYCGDI